MSAKMNKPNFEVSYNSNIKKDNFFRKVSAESLTNQDQLANAKISIMAEKFGIDALISKAKKQTIELDLQAELYGNDLSNFITNKTDLLQTKANIRRLFERIPAIIRKETFGDNVENFIECYTSGNVEKLEKLVPCGIVNNNQINALKEHYANIEKQRIEAENANFEAIAKRLNYVKATESTQTANNSESKGEQKNV